MLANLISPISAFWQQNRQSPKAIPVIIVVVTVTIIVLFKLVQPEPPVKEKQEKSWAVQSTTLRNGAKIPQLALFGQVESPYTSTITSTVTADVAMLNIREGDTVTKKQALLVLDDSEVRLIVEQRLSDVAELEAQLKSEKNRHKNDLASLKLEKSLVALAEKKLSREEKTSKSNLTSQSSFDSQKQALQNQKLALKARQLNVTDHPARLAQLQARLKQKRALAQQAEKDLLRTTVNAPFDGIILKTFVAPGERVRPGENLLELYSTDNVELRAQLPQRFIDVVKQKLSEGESLKGIAKTKTGNIDVTLHRISGAISETGNGVDALFSITSDDALKLIIGEVLDVIVDLPPIENVYRVPVSAIYGTNRLYRINDNRLSAIKVLKKGNQIEANKQFILVQSKQLSAGDEIVITQLPHAVTGLKVEVRNETQTSEDELSD